MNSRSHTFTLLGIDFLFSTPQSWSLNRRGITEVTVGLLSTILLVFFSINAWRSEDCRWWLLLAEGEKASTLSRLHLCCLGCQHLGTLITLVQILIIVIVVSRWSKRHVNGYLFCPASATSNVRSFLEAAHAIIRYPSYTRTLHKS